jgi:antitoxin HigA-1
MTTPTHPGTILRDELKKRKITHKEFAKRIGWYAPHFSDLINGKSRRITTETAKRIARELEMIPQYWLELQAEYDLNKKH